MPTGFDHTPALLTATIDALRPSSGGLYIDATVGGGGHAEKVLQLSSPAGVLLGIDADPMALEAARLRLAPYDGRFTLVESYYDRLAELARQTGFFPADGVLFDLGVSSPQLDRPERGFSFSADGPLDMRLGPSADRTAADLVNELPAAELQRIFSQYGEERHSGRIARRIVEERRRGAITTTGHLASLVAAASPPAAGRGRIHPATRVFQALRIAVNDELSRLSEALPQAVELLRAGGRLAVISFHSLEDRIVKRFMRQEARGCTCPPELPVCVCGRSPRLREVTRRPLVASSEEVAANPRARSARLRVAERTEVDTKP